ncbi:MAG: energy-coupling factor transporter ATPase [Phoenicibacter congonensis]|uniref:Energy-coupling factor transporter ATP-binding protein EcfA2 n=1 Tax=Phoenicibacter congonensis TaxID=1944646 RepID=A0AA43UAR4_9ACTN|nr:energy-coupling factor transporter ATPase [Phoenicibacter congonensis]
MMEDKMSIRIENLTHIYNKGLSYETVALDHVSLTIEDGEFVGIIGHTGSGKSTLIQHMNGILKPDSGSVVVNGVDITEKGVKLADIRKKVGLVFQYPEYQLFEDTVAKDIAFGPGNLGLAPEEVDFRVREAMEMVALDYEIFAERSPFELSGGQKRRVAIAGVIAMKPEVLILDEPTAGLDPRAHGDIIGMLQRLHQRSECNILLVSHNMEDMAKIADRIIVMDKGRVFAQGTPREIYGNSEELLQIGLEIPQAMKFVSLLETRGLTVKRDIMTMEEAVEEAERLLRNRL